MKSSIVYKKKGYKLQYFPPPHLKLKKKKEEKNCKLKNNPQLIVLFNLIMLIINSQFYMLIHPMCVLHVNLFYLMLISPFIIFL